jgi:hypothetical protein
MHDLHVKNSQRTSPTIQSSLNGCAHQFCIRCIRKWSKVSPFLCRPKILVRCAASDTTRSDIAIESLRSLLLHPRTGLRGRRSFHLRIHNSEG